MYQQREDKDCIESERVSRCHNERASPSLSFHFLLSPSISFHLLLSPSMLTSRANLCWCHREKNDCINREKESVGVTLSESPMIVSQREGGTFALVVNTERDRRR